MTVLKAAARIVGSLLAILVAAVIALANTRATVPNLPVFQCPAHALDHTERCETHPRRDASSSGAVRLQYFGASTIVLTAQGRSVIVDAFFSRPGWWQLLFTGVDPDSERLRDAFSMIELEKIETVMVAHSHHDHAMDVAPLAADLKPSAVIRGSSMTHQVAQAWTGSIEEHLLASRLRPIEEEFGAGPFVVKAIEAPHTPNPLMFQIEEGEMPESGWKMPARLWQFKHDVNYSLYFEHECGRILVVPSAAPLGRDYPEADVVLLGIGGLGNLVTRDPELVKDYWKQAVVATRAKLVFLIHWDDFTEPLDFSRPLMPMPALPYLMDEMPWTVRQLEHLTEHLTLESVSSSKPKLMLLPTATEVELPAYGVCDVTASR